MNKESINILVINAGSATLKFSLFDQDLNQRLFGIIERIGLKNSFFEYQQPGYRLNRINYARGITNHTEALKLVIGEINLLGFQANLIGHRVVHGGEKFTQPTLITPRTIRQLEKYSVLAPLHNPANLAAIKGCLKLLPNVKNVALFDTAFNATLQPKAYIYSLPLKYYHQYKIRKYGFHGLSHQYVAEQAARQLKKPLSQCNLITCHLGSGCSLCAIQNGRSIDTTMGFTPLEGLTMATRSGDLDPAIVIYLIERLGLSVKQVEQLLTKESGWKGVSGISSDLREVLVAVGYKVPGFYIKKKFTASQRQAAKLAVEIFVYDVQRYLSAYLGILPRTDAIVFTAGIGERNSTIRRLILKGIHRSPKTRVLVIPTHEEFIIAREAAQLVRK